jgi:diguanylate cyclase (GGDEF)-like protein
MLCFWLNQEKGVPMGIQNIILVVDKADITALMLAGMLKNLSVQIISAGSEKEALNLLAGSDHVIKAVVWVLKGNNPEELEPVARLKDNALFRNIPVIIISQFMGGKQIMAAMESGVYEHIDKPCDDEYIRSKICEVLGIPYPKPFVREEDITIFNFTEMLNKEIKSAARGNYPLSIFEIDFCLDSASGGIIDGWDDKMPDLIKQILKTALRDTDTAFRYGNGQFIILLPFTDVRGTLLVEKKIRKIIMTHSILGQKIYNLDFVSSVVCYPEDGKVNSKLLEKLEKSLNCLSTAIHSTIDKEPEPFDYI